MDRRIIPLQRALEQTKRRNSDIIYSQNTDREGLVNQSRNYEDKIRMLNSVFESPPELMYIPIV